MTGLLVKLFRYWTFSIILSDVTFYHNYARRGIFRLLTIAAARKLSKSPRQRPFRARLEEKLLCLC